MSARLSSFAYYSDPTGIIAEGGDRQLYVGLGASSLGTESAVVDILDGNDTAAIYLDRSELAVLIDTLMETLGAMDVAP